MCFFLIGHSLWVENSLWRPAIPYLKPGTQPPLKGKGSKMSNLMIRFIDEYFVDLVGTKAIIRAGYKVKPGNEDRIATDLLRHPLVSAEIARRMAIRAQKNELTAEYVIQKLVKIVEETDVDNPQAALRGLELLGKHLGLYRDRQEISGPDGGAIEMEQKVQEDVTDFKSKLDRLVDAAGKGVVVGFPKPSRSSEA